MSRRRPPPHQGSGVMDDPSTNLTGAGQAFLFLTAQETCDFNIHYRLRRYSTESKFPQHCKKYLEQASNPSAHSPTVSTQYVSVSFGCG